jgi:hypothetical protein
MTDFEFLMALFGLLYALIVAELALKFADAIDLHRDRPMGVLTPALAFLFLTDVTSFWVFIWGARGVLKVSWHSVFSGVFLAILYLIAAALIFPRDKREWRHLDDHYWRRKRFVAGAMLIVNLAVDGALLTRAIPAWNDWWFYFYFPSYLLALIGLVLSRSKRLDYVFLGWAIFANLCAGFDLLPNSHFGSQLGLAQATMERVTQ